MRLEIGWDTTHAYPEPVRVLHTELHVVPTTRPGQRVLRTQLTIEPDAPLNARPDAFGNTVHHFDHLGSVARVKVQMDAVVETTRGRPEAPNLTPLEHHLWLQPTFRCPFALELQSFADRSIGTPIQLAEAMQEEMADRFAFQPGHTEVTDTALHLLQHGRGICQDFAHLMLAALRMRGVPARYVSGYLSTRPGADATHAWVQLWHDGAWHGFDPANDCRQDERYVVVGVGRDYDDVAPIRGSYRGSTEEAWHAMVKAEAGQPQ